MKRKYTNKETDQSTIMGRSFKAYVSITYWKKRPKISDTADYKYTTNQEHSTDIY